MKKAAIIILAAGMKKDSRGHWSSTGLVEEDERWGSPGGYLRVLAASLLYQQNPDSTVIASGGEGWEIDVEDKNPPLLAEVMERELIELGVPREQIVKETVSKRTYTQLLECWKIVGQQGFESASIVSNWYHLPRIKVMIEHKEDLSGWRSFENLNLISAEEVVSENRPDYKEGVRKALRDKRTKQIVADEKRGVEEIIKGTYKYER